jgi:hypothetical protein
MKTNHTPAPWTIGEVKEGRKAIFYTQMNAICIMGEDLMEHYNQEANANLIASAPELLQLAQTIMIMADDDRFTKYPEWIGIVDQAKEAIAKATGETITH